MQKRYTRAMGAKGIFEIVTTIITHFEVDFRAAGVAGTADAAVARRCDIPCRYGIIFYTYCGGSEFSASIRGIASGRALARLHVRHEIIKSSETCLIPGGAINS